MSRISKYISDNVDMIISAGGDVNNKYLSMDERLEKTLMNG